MVQADFPSQRLHSQGWKHRTREVEFIGVEKKNGWQPMFIQLFDIPVGYGGGQEPEKDTTTQAY
ncbi:MAG: hypothetical protein V3R28_01295, partial [Desulfatiglandales bacterium]